MAFQDSIPHKRTTARRSIVMAVTGGVMKSCLLFFVIVIVASAADDKPKRPAIKKLGTIDLLMVETTPVVFKHRLYRFEYVRDNYHANKSGVSHFRFIDVATAKSTPAFAKGKHLGCAFVDG